MQRIPGLDGVRGIAILMVVASHAHPPSYAVGGIAGVTLFFVLSGFLITRLLLEESSLRHFYLRRAFRLLPPLILFLTVAGIWLGWNRVWPAALYISNYAQIFGAEMEPLRHTWSLAVEEHFYLIWPLVLLSFPSARKPSVLVTAIALSAGWRLLVPSGLWAYQGTDTNAYALGLGCLLVFIIEAWQPPRWLFYVALVGLLAVGTHLPTSFTASGRWIGLLSAILSGIVIWVAVRRPIGWLSFSMLRITGRVSYSWYLWHVPLIAWAIATDGRLLPVAIVGSLLAAIVSWVALERPLLRLRDRLISSADPASFAPSTVVSPSTV